MNSYFKKVIEYTAGNFFTKFIYFLLIPILSRQLIPEEYAVYGNITIFMAFASMLFLLGIQQSLYPYFYENKEKSYRFMLISSVTITLLFTGILFTSLIISNAALLSHLITRSALYTSVIPLVGLAIFADSLFAISLSFLNIQEKSAPYIILGSLKNLLFLGLILIFSILSKLTILLLFQIMLVVSILSAVSALLVILKLQNGYLKNIDHPTYYSTALIKDMLKFGLVMVPGTLAMMVLRMSDRYMITWLSTGQLYDTGIYSIGYRIGLIMQFPVSMVSMVYFPYAMKIAKNSDAYDNYSNAFKQFAVLGGILGILLILFSRELILIFADSAYSESYKYVFAGVMSAYLLGLFNISNLISYVEKKAGSIAFAVITGAVLNIILNYFGIIKIGIMGAAVSSVISYLIILILNIYRLRKRKITIFKLVTPFVVVLLMAVCGYANTILPNNSLILLAKIGLALILLFSSLQFEIIKKYIKILRDTLKRIII